MPAGTDDGMKNQSDVYASAHIDAAVVSALSRNSNEKFWKQAYTNAIYRTRIAAIQGSVPEPSLRETAALLDNGTVLDGLFEAAAAKTAETEHEHDGINSRKWLHHDWHGLDQELRNTIRDDIRQAGASKLTVRCLALSAAPTAIGDRRGEWIRDGRLLWETSQLPEYVQGAIETAVEELFSDPERPTTNVGPQQVVNARRGVIDSIDNAMAAANALGLLNTSERERWKDDIRKWREDNTVANAERISAAAPRTPIAPTRSTSPDARTVRTGPRS